MTRPSRLLSTLAFFVGLLPWSALPFFGRVLAFVAFDLLRIRRRHVLDSLARIGHGAEAARAMFQNLGRAALELLWLSAHPRAPADAFVRVANRAAFDDALALGRGVVVATAHTGNWDLAACACAAITPLSVVTKRLSSSSIDAWWQGTRAGRGVDLLAAPDGHVMSRVRERLSTGRAVALLVDQDPERTRSVVEAPFLGERALHDTLAATLAARTGAPIVVAFATRDAVVEVLDVHVPPPHAGRAWIERTTRAIAGRLDAFVREDPACWLWLHRRWKTRLQGTQVPREHFMPGGHSDGPLHS